MDLTDLRLDFTRISGRSELSVVDVDKYINRGQNYLDLLTDFKHARARDFQVVAANALSVTFTSKCRVIQEVWVMDAIQGRTQLQKLDMNTFRREYPALPTPVAAVAPGPTTVGSITIGTTALTVLSTTGFLVGYYITIGGVTGVKRITAIVGLVITIDSAASATVVLQPVVGYSPAVSAGTKAARPIHYTPALLRTSTTDPATGNPIPITIGDFAQYLGFMDVNVTGTSHAFDGVIFRPSTDQQYVIETFGKFYTPDLTAADPDSWWTFTAYTAALHAALRELEVDYRNTAGANDWEDSIRKITSMLSMDDAEEDAIDINAFEAE
jgi:hypothetical protein